MAPALRDSCVNTVSQKRRRKQCLIMSLCWPSVPLCFFLLNLKNAIKKLHTLFSAQCFSVILQWGLFFSVKDWVVSLTTKGNDDKEIIHRKAQQELVCPSLNIKTLNMNWKLFTHWLPHKHVAVSPALTPGQRRAVGENSSLLAALVRIHSLTLLVLSTWREQHWVAVSHNITTRHQTKQHLRKEDYC